MSSPAIPQTGRECVKSFVVPPSESVGELIQRVWINTQLQLVWADCDPLRPNCEDRPLLFRTRPEMGRGTRTCTHLKGVSMRRGKLTEFPDSLTSVRRNNGSRSFGFL